MEQVYIETQDLSVGYHGKALLKDIALKVKKGEILVLIGPNGAGTVSYTHLTLPTT